MNVYMDDICVYMLYTSAWSCIYGNSETRCSQKKERTQQARKNKETIAVLFVIKIFTKVRARMLAVFEELPQ